jgi:multidrug resistance efflux pump
MLKVTGSIVARLPPGKVNELAEGRWDFNTSDLSSAYADWIKARADVPFNEKQLVSIRELSAATLKAKKEVADRLEKLVHAGTDPEKDLAAAKADYLQAKLQSQKDEHEAETNVKNAQRTLATLERQLYQAGIDPD